MENQGGQGGAGAGGEGGGAGAGSGAGAPPAVDWTSSFNEEQKGFITNKGFKEPVNLLDSYRNSEKLIHQLRGTGSDRIIGLPEKDDAPEWKDVHYKLGVPKEAKEYQFEVPKEHGDEKFVDWARSTMHKLNIPRKAAEGLVKEWNQYVGSRHSETTAARQAEIDKQANTLKTEWGSAYDQNLKLAQTAAKEFGFTAEVIDQLENSMGYAGVHKLMHTLGSKIGEHQFQDGGKGGMGGNLTPGQAQSEIAARMSDTDFQQRVAKGEKAAVDEWTRLNKALAAGSPAE